MGHITRIKAERFRKSLQACCFATGKGPKETMRMINKARARGESFAEFLAATLTQGDDHGTNRHANPKA